MRTKKTARKSSAAPTFISEAAAERYEKFDSQKVLCPEKGFIFNTTPTLGYPEMIHSVVEARGWHKFCLQPEEALVPLVREFCANFASATPDVVTVRGVAVRMDPDAITLYYGLTAVEDEYVTFLENLTPRQLKNILARLCVAGTRWNISRQGAYTFPRNSLTPEARIWYHFLKSRLMPSTHVQTVSKDRAALLFCLLEGMRIDVGRIVHEKLCQAANKQTGHILFPALITGLCQQSGVAFGDAEERLKMTGVITPAAVARIVKDGGEQRKRAADSETSDEERGEKRKRASHSETSDEDQPESSSRPATRSRSKKKSPAAADDDAIAGLELRMRQFELTQLNILVELKEMKSQLLRMSRQQRDVWRYMKSRDLAVMKNFRANYSKLHAFPAFPSHVLDTPIATAEPDAPESEED